MEPVKTLSREDIAMYPEFKDRKIGETVTAKEWNKAVVAYQEKNGGEIPSPSDPAGAGSTLAEKDGVDGEDAPRTTRAPRKSTK